MNLCKCSGVRARTQEGILPESTSSQVHRHKTKLFAQVGLRTLVDTL
jgi:hypothetical protein